MNKFNGKPHSEAQEHYRSWVDDYLDRLEPIRQTVLHRLVNIETMYDWNELNIELGQECRKLQQELQALADANGCHIDSVFAALRLKLRHGFVDRQDIRECRSDIETALETVPSKPRQPTLIFGMESEVPAPPPSRPRQKTLIFGVDDVKPVTPAPERARKNFKSRIRRILGKSILGQRISGGSENS